MNAPLWTYADIIKATGGKGSGAGPVYGIAIDSREAAPGDLFIALAGAETDGHGFVKSAFDMGAAAALVSKPPKGVAKDDARLIWVTDTTAALDRLARAARKRSTARIIAITGTAGKTGVKDVLYETFVMKGKTHAPVRSFNNRVGVPLTLARMPRDTAFGVFEVGMSAPGETLPLAKLIRPDGALITTVGKGHMAAFETEADIAKEKAAVFEGVREDGFAILNFDNPHFELLKQLADKQGIKNILTFSTRSDAADAHLLKSVAHDRCSCISAAVGDTVVTYKVAMPGRHWIMNSLAVLLCAGALGGDLGLAGLALAGYSPQVGRGRVYDIEAARGRFQVVDESYNANPSSLRAALEVFSRMTPVGKRGRKIAVLGDMEELGPGVKEEHLALAEDIQNAGIDLLYVKGPGMEALLEALSPEISGFAFSDNPGICQKLEQDIVKGDLVLIKGSRTGRLDQVTDHLKSLAVPETVTGWGIPAQAA